MLPVIAAMTLSLQAGPEAPPPPPAAMLVHGLAYFEPGAVRRNARAGFDPITYLAAKVPADAVVFVRGQTETAGDAAANLELSFRRARSVADELVALGIRPGQITLFGCGEAFLAVPTPDGVVEPLNNLVEFDWGRGPRNPPSGCVAQPYQPPR